MIMPQQFDRRIPDVIQFFSACHAEKLPMPSMKYKHF